MNLPPKTLKKKSNFKEALLFFLDILLNVLIIVALVYLVRKFLVAPFQVYGPSMCNAFNYENGECQKGYGEYLVVNKVGYLTGDPERGDIVVFHPPEDRNNFYIKRVIGMPGESLKIEDGEVFIKKNKNAEWEQIQEKYLNENNRGKTANFGRDNNEFDIPKNSYFVMGDNRRASTDSRSCFVDPFGGGCKGESASPFITKEHIEGKAWMVLWPFSKFQTIEEADYSFTPLQ